MQHLQSSHNRELVTVITTICADGQALKPSIIFKGKNLQEAWVKDNPMNAQ